MVAITRRAVLASGVGAAVLAALPLASTKAAGTFPRTLTTRDGTSIFFKDFGEGPPIVLSHAWTLSADQWDTQMMTYAAAGYRVVAHDRRSHGRSGQPSQNDIDAFADDLAALIERLDLRDIILVGHSMGGGEVARYVGRHGTDRVRKVVLVASVTPWLQRGAGNPDGVPAEVFDGIRAEFAADRADFIQAFAAPIFGVAPESTAYEGLRRDCWRIAMQGGIRGQIEAVSAFAATDFTADLERMSVPTLVIHGGADAVVPKAVSAERAARLLPHAKLTIYDDAPHMIPMTHRARFDADLLAFART